MNDEQLKAAKQLGRALNRCGSVGLTGGVFDGSFCLWPADAVSPHRIEESGANDFFGAVEEESDGFIVPHRKIYLDGGAGN